MANTTQLPENYRNSIECPDAAEGIAELVSERFKDTLLKGVQYFFTNDKGVLEVTLSPQKGYEFVYPLQSDRDFQTRLERRMRQSKNDGRTIDAYFVDNRPSEMIAGFRWSRK